MLDFAYHASFDQFSVHKFFEANIEMDFEVCYICFLKEVLVFAVSHMRHELHFVAFASYFVA